MLERTQRYLDTLGRIPTAEEYRDVLRMSRRGFFGATAGILTATYFNFNQGTMGHGCPIGMQGTSGLPGPGPCPKGDPGPPGDPGRPGSGIEFQFAASQAGPWHDSLLLNDRYERVSYLPSDGYSPKLPEVWALEDWPQTPESGQKTSLDQPLGLTFPQTRRFYLKLKRV